jgi:hypothetical protein
MNPFSQYGVQLSRFQQNTGVKKAAFYRGQVRVDPSFRRSPLREDLPSTLRIAVALVKQCEQSQQTWIVGVLVKLFEKKLQNAF